MKKKIIILIILVITLSLSVFAGYFIAKYKWNIGESEDNSMEGKTPPKVTEPLGNGTQTPEKNTDPIKNQIGQMTLEEKVGQMIIVGVEGSTFNSSIGKMIDDYHVGGFIFMGTSIKNANQLLKLVNSIKTANSNNKIPLFLSTDEEGGRVERMPQEFERYPTNYAIGKIDNEGLSYNIGNTIAHEISSFGFNVDFAPVLDINSNPKNPVIGDRSFGTNPQLVSSLGVETMKGLQGGNMITVVKHFPGHGDTSVDSHVGLPKVNKDLKQLSSFELIPFTQAIKNNVDGIMIAHILLPNIDSKYPASMSKVVISDILRKQLGYNGVVITDDMTMGAITQNYSIGDATVKSVDAGSDIILIAHDYTKGIAAVTSIINAVNSGSIKVDRINESVYRILKLKEKYNLEDRTINSVNVDEINSKIKGVLKDYFK